MSIAIAAFLQFIMQLPGFYLLELYLPFTSRDHEAGSEMVATGKARLSHVLRGNRNGGSGNEGCLPNGGVSPGSNQDNSVAGSEDDELAALFDTEVSSAWAAWAASKQWRTSGDGG